MKTTRYTAAGLFVVLSIVAILVLSYGTPFGRRAARQALRTTRLVRNATQIYPQPVLTVRMWGGSRQAAFRADVYESGRFVVSGRQGADGQLPRDTAERLVEIGRAALGDFNSQGCNTVTNGMNADLYLVIDGEWRGSVCRSLSDWPRGPETRRLLGEISNQLPRDMKLPIEF